MSKLEVTDNIVDQMSAAVISPQSYIDELTKIAAAGEDMLVDDLIDLFNPTNDRAEMGGKYEKVLGYNPITKFDIGEICNIVDAIDFADLDIAQSVIAEIKVRAHQLYEERRTANMNRCIIDATFELAGKDAGRAIRKSMSTSYPSIALENKPTIPVNVEPAKPIIEDEEDGPSISTDDFSDDDEDDESFIESDLGAYDAPMSIDSEIRDFGFDDDDDDDL